MSRSSERRLLRRAIVAGCLLFFGHAGPVRAQVDTGALTGAVVDATGGALPGVTITVTSLSTGVVRTALTNEIGRYQVTALQPAAYSVKAELQGFGAIVRPQVTVNIGSTIDVNITLSVANVSETVNVTGAAPLLESAKT